MIESGALGLSFGQLLGLAGVIWAIPYAAVAKGPCISSGPQVTLQARIGVGPRAVTTLPRNLTDFIVKGPKSDAERVCRLLVRAETSRRLPAALQVSVERDCRSTPLPVIAGGDRTRRYLLEEVGPQYSGLPLMVGADACGAAALGRTQITRRQAMVLSSLSECERLRREREAQIDSARLQAARRAKKWLEEQLRRQRVVLRKACAEAEEAKARCDRLRRRTRGRKKHCKRDPAGAICRRKQSVALDFYRCELEEGRIKRGCGNARHLVGALRKRIKAERISVPTSPPPRCRKL